MMLDTRSSVAGATDRTEQPLSLRQQGQPGAVLEVPERPVLAPDVQLLGAMQGSGFQERQWLVLRGSRFIQLTELLYRLAEQVNGERPLEEIAARVTEATTWIVSADQARRLIQTKLMPLGLIATEHGQPHRAAGKDRRPGPLGVNMRRKVIGPPIIDPITAVLQVLYRPPVLIPVLLAIAAAQGWLYVVHGVSRSLYAAVHTPGLFLAAVAIVLVSGVFHEFGHAAALRYGGGKARAIGVALYLVYPAFYTDTTESYRLGRWARVRTDLGGFYFHLIFALGLMVLYVLSRQEFFLLTVLLIDLDIVNQCLPYVRFDGYWALADLTGLPDFFALMGPFVRSVWPWRRGQGSAGRLPPLKLWVKVVFALYIVVTIPLLLVLLGLTIRNVPHMVVILWGALLQQAAWFGHAARARDYLGMAMALAMMLLVLLQAAGLAALFYTLGRGRAWRLLRALWTWSTPTLKRWSTPTLRRRLGGGLITAGTSPTAPGQTSLSMSGGIVEAGEQPHGTCPGGDAALQTPRSRAPSPLATFPPAVAEAVLAYRRSHPGVGARRAQVALQQDLALRGLPLPDCSTIHRAWVAAGLVTPRGLPPGGGRLVRRADVQHLVAAGGTSPPNGAVRPASAQTSVGRNANAAAGAPGTGAAAPGRPQPAVRADDETVEGGPDKGHVIS